MGPILIETVLIIIGIGFNVRIKNPLNLWGDSVVSLFCNLLILLLASIEQNRILISSSLLVGLLWFMKSLMDPKVVTEDLMSVLLMCCFPLMITGAFSQIYGNYKVGHMGIMSESTLMMGFLCGIGRVFVAFVEVDDAMTQWISVFWGCVGTVLIIQMRMYRRATKAYLDSKEN
jgi:hypothetical protein